jgi:hypothetical protein
MRKDDWEMKCVSDFESGLLTSGLVQEHEGQSRFSRETDDDNDGTGGDRGTVRFSGHN